MRGLLISLPVYAVLAGLFWMAGHDGRLPWQPPPAHGADWCATHGVPLSRDEKCNPKLARGGTTVVREREPGEGECPNTCVRITLGPGVMEQAGIEVVEVRPRAVSETLVANAETRYDPTRYARVAPRLTGVVREVKVSLGQHVSAGATLAVVESLDLAQAKADLVHARALLDLRSKSVERLKPYGDARLLAPRELLEAESQASEARLELERSRRRLLTFGLAKDRVDALSADEPPSSLVEVVAPFEGTVLEVAAVVGETASPERPLFSVADVGRLWLRIDVREEDVPKIEAGQRAVFTVEGLPGKRFSGTVATLGSEVDDRTRTVPVTAEVKNGEGLLRANLFGRAEIRVRPPEPKLLVPKDAVQNDGDCWLAFVMPTPRVFHARKIEIGTVYEGGYEVTGGLAAGDKVATTGSFLLKTEVLRGQMGAG